MQTRECGDCSLCCKLPEINYFKTTKYNKIDTTESGWSTDVKQGIDLSIQPDTNIPIINDYLHCMKDGVELYFKRYPEANHLTDIAELFNIQYYPSGGGFKAWHCERDREQTNQRSLVFMTYLNDVDDGGQTQFLYQKKEIQPKKGLTVLWPTDFTHTHRGVTSPTQTKIIATGWYNYLDVKGALEFLKVNIED